MDKKKQIIEVFMKYVSEDKTADLKRFREESKSEYFLVNHYFGSIENLLEITGTRRGVTSYGNAQCRNKLALDRLEDLRKQGKTYQEIADEYNVSKSAINSLHLKLKKTVK